MAFFLIQYAHSTDSCGDTKLSSSLGSKGPTLLMGQCQFEFSKFNNDFSVDSDFNLSLGPINNFAKLDLDKADFSQIPLILNERIIILESSISKKSKPIESKTYLMKIEDRNSGEIFEVKSKFIINNDLEAFDQSVIYPL